MSLELEHRMEISWRQTPLLMVEGAEVLRNMTRTVPEGEDLNRDYIEVRNTLIEKRYAIVGATGRNKRGKGSMLMGWFRTLKQDQELKSDAQELGVKEIEIVPVLFVQAREAAKLPGTDLNRGSIIPQDLAYSEWTYAHPRRVSKFQWSFIDSFFPSKLKTPEQITRYLKEQGRMVVFLVEGSTPLARPLSFKEKNRRKLREGPPIVVRGLQDLGISVIGNIAVDPRFKDNCKLYFVISDPELRDDEASNDFRRNPKFGHEQEIKAVVTINGQEFDVADLPEIEQQKYAAVLKKSTASPELVSQLDNALDAFEESLYAQEIIHSPNDDGLFGFLSGSLDNNRFRRVLNPRFMGQKTYDLEYLKQGLIYKKNPQIYSELNP